MFTLFQSCIWCKCLSTSGSCVRTSSQRANMVMLEWVIKTVCQIVVSFIINSRNSLKLIMFSNYQASRVTEHLEIFITWTSLTIWLLSQNFPQKLSCWHGWFYSVRAILTLIIITHHFLNFADFLFGPRLCIGKHRLLILHPMWQNSNQTKDIETTENSIAFTLPLTFQIWYYRLCLIMSILGHRR